MSYTAHQYIAIVVFLALGLVMFYVFHIAVVPLIIGFAMGVIYMAWMWAADRAEHKRDYH